MTKVTSRSGKPTARRRPAAPKPKPILTAPEVPTTETFGEALLGALDLAPLSGYQPEAPFGLGNWVDGVFVPFESQTLVIAAGGIEEEEPPYWPETLEATDVLRYAEGEEIDYYAVALAREVYVGDRIIKRRHMPLGDAPPPFDPAAILRAEVDKLEIKAEATGEATRAETDPLSLLEDGETVMGQRLDEDGVLFVVTTFGRKVGIGPDGSFSILNGPDFPARPEEVSDTESADA
jgi:hypothetical protein